MKNAAYVLRFLFFALLDIQGGFLISDKKFISALQYVENREYSDIHNDSLCGCSREIKKILAAERQCRINAEYSEYYT